MSKIEKGEWAADLKKVGEGSEDAMRRVAAVSPGMNSMMRTTCVATQLEADMRRMPCPNWRRPMSIAAFCHRDSIENVLRRKA